MFAIELSRYIYVIEYTHFICQILVIRSSTRWTCNEENRYIIKLPFPFCQPTNTDVFHSEPTKLNNISDILRYFTLATRKKVKRWFNY